MTESKYPIGTIADVTFAGLRKRAFKTTVARWCLQGHDYLPSESELSDITPVPIASAPEPKPGPRWTVYNYRMSGIYHLRDGGYITGLTSRVKFRVQAIADLLNAAEEN